MKRRNLVPRLVLLFVAVIVEFNILFLAAPAWAQSVIYTQPWSGSDKLWASQNAPPPLGNFATTYNPISSTICPTGCDITGVNWTGGYFNPASQGPITAWSVTFWADASAQPGAMLHTFICAGTCGETFLGNVGPNQIPFYSYSAVTNFVAGPGTMYWLSVVPDLAYPPQWGWGDSPVGSGVAYQDSFGNRHLLPTGLVCNTSGPCNQDGPQKGVNLAFNLIGTPVGTPEPGSLIPLGTGGIALVGGVRRTCSAKRGRTPNWPKSLASRL